MYHCFSCDARRDSIRDPWNCHQCGSDFVDLVQDPCPQEPQPAPANPFGTQPNPAQQVHGIRAGGGPAPVHTQSIPRTPLGSNFGPPPNSGGIGGIRRSVQRRIGGATSSAQYMTAGTSRRALVAGRPAMQLQTQSANPFGVPAAAPTQSLTSLFNNLPPMYQRPTPAPINRGRPQMFVTPDGRIVDQPTMPGVASQEEIHRRQNALVIKKLSDKQKEDPCSICLDDHENQAAFLPKCGHFFHQTCMGKWLEQKNSCPLCQEQVA